MIKGRIKILGVGVATLDTHGRYTYGVAVTDGSSVVMLTAAKLKQEQEIELWSRVLDLPIDEIVRMYKEISNMDGKQDFKLSKIDYATVN